MAQTVPTKSNLLSAKKSLELAQSGYELLDRKHEILAREIRSMLASAEEIQKEIDQVYSAAYLALQRANVTLGMCYEFSQAVPIDNSLEIGLRSVMGVELPIVKLAQSKPEIYYGINATNSLLDEAYMQFEQVKQMTARLAQTQACMVRLANAIKKTKKRTNALKYVMIPRFQSTIKFISDSLEESERESFSRLKVIKNRSDI